MQQIWITKAGPPEVLQIREMEDPEPADNEVVIAVGSAGINFADIMARLGVYQDAPDLPTVVGYEVSGYVEKSGSQVTGYKEGDKVIGMTRFQGYSSKVALHEAQVFPLPDHWDFHQGAGFPVNYITAYQLLVVMGSLHEGDKVLIHSVGGGVGIAATQIAALYNASVFGTASAWKHEYLKKHGVEFPLDYHEYDFVEEIDRLTGGKGVEIVLDPVGGKHWKRSYRCLSPTGRLLLYGASKMAPGKSKSLWSALKTVIQMPHLYFHPIRLISENKGVLGVNVGHLWEERDRVTQWVDHLLQWASEERIEPKIDKVFSFAEASLAHHYIQDRKNLGKVCLTPEK